MKYLCSVSMFGAMLFCTLLSTSPAAAGTHPPNRNGFFIGFGAGWGNAGTEVTLFDAGDRENSVSANFRLGWAISDNATLGLESTTWLKQYDVAIFAGDMRLTGTVTAFALTYFPQNMGLYFRGGVGLAAASAEFNSGALSFEDTELGLGLLGAVGYEWRITPKFAIGPQAQWAYMDIEGDGLESADFVSLTAQATWYW
jgi:hypothetical protein